LEKDAKNSSNSKTSSLKKNSSIKKKSEIKEQNKDLKKSKDNLSSSNTPPRQNLSSDKSKKDNDVKSALKFKELSNNDLPELTKSNSVDRNVNLKSSLKLDKDKTDKKNKSVRFDL